VVVGLGCSSLGGDHQKEAPRRSCGASYRFTINNFPAEWIKSCSSSPFTYVTFATISLTPAALTILASLSEIQ